MNHSQIIGVRERTQSTLLELIGIGQQALRRATDYAKERVFERLFSLKDKVTGHKGSGLGLCFVREAAELHGGHASLENRTDEEGAEATFWVPAG